MVSVSFESGWDFVDPFRVFPKKQMKFGGLGLKEDRDIVRRAQKGDGEAFRSLLLRYYRPIFNLVFRLTGNREDAEDIMQETFLRVYKGLGSFECGRAFRPWIYRIARNLCIDRSRKRGRSIPEESLDDNMIVESRMCGFKPGPDQVYDHKELRETLVKAIGNIGIGYRELIILFHLEGLSIKEISEITGLKGTVVKNRLYRGRLALKMELQKQFESAGDGGILP